MCKFCVTYLLTYLWQPETISFYTSHDSWEPETTSFNTSHDSWEPKTTSFNTSHDSWEPETTSCYTSHDSWEPETTSFNTSYDSWEPETTSFYTSHDSWEPETTSFYTSHDSWEPVTLSRKLFYFADVCILLSFTYKNNGFIPLISSLHGCWQTILILIYWQIILSYNTSLDISKSNNNNRRNSCFNNLYIFKTTIHMTYSTS